VKNVSRVEERPRVVYIRSEWRSTPSRRAVRGEHIRISSVVGRRSGSYKCQNRKIVIEPPSHAGQLPREQAQRKRYQRRKPSDADADIDIDLKPSHVSAKKGEEKSVVTIPRCQKGHSVLSTSAYGVLHRGLARQLFASLSLNRPPNSVQAPLHCDR
jgi:hypothetical protein